MIQFIHLPYGTQNPYLRESAYERNPFLPLKGVKVILNYLVNTAILGQRSHVEMFIGAKKKTIRAQCQKSTTEGSYWRAELPATETGTTVKYRLIFGRDKETAQASEWFEYTTKEWKDVTDSVRIDGNTITVDQNRDVVEKELAVVKRINKIEILTDARDIYDIRYTFYKSEGEKFYGLGEHYDSLNLEEGEDYYCLVYDQCKVQKKKGYAPVPFLFSDKGFGLFFDTGFPTKYVISENKLQVTLISSDIPCNKLIVRYWIDSTPEKIIGDFYSIAQPVLPPDWVFGPWMSANQWNSQKKMETVLKKAKELNLPATVAVIEAWSDEQSFYIFNGADYNPVEGEESLGLRDFRFKDPWPDPEKMVKTYHEAGIKLILWQIPVLKPTEEFRNYRQHKVDMEYAMDKKYVVMREDGDFYRIPKTKWFEDSLVVDFFNDEAAKWWQSKRKYLTEELCIDGFKTDGGEHLWFRDTVVNRKDSAAAKRNNYPEKYFETANGILNSDEKVLFSRAGYARSARSSIFWVGDEDSNYDAMRENFIAGLNVSICGNPFWAWDIAGFSGGLPELDLYKNAIWNSVFVPIFQFHSEDPGDPVPSAERSPWNIAEHYNDDSVIDLYRKAVSLRMSLLPYISREAAHCSDTGSPLTCPLMIRNPECTADGIAYYFGRDMIVYPNLEEGKKTGKIILPEGEWINLWTGEMVEGVRDHPFTISDKPQVFVKKMAAIPLCLPETGNLLDPDWTGKENARLIFAEKAEMVENHGYNPDNQRNVTGYLSKQSDNQDIVSIAWEAAGKKE
ncbi:MAG TPA: glycoside hydrolase family 31 protein [Thermotogota bacterium]|nr:glycoside hydrolase family 31 protein [Thermotogota bacterium]HPR95211.1 glycoside hydrolase family 31 protein [Thermotogota bacterium]